MTTFVLVGGFWIGAWAWRDVAVALERDGHRAISPDLTGLGAKKHLGGPQVTLETHIDDVIGAIEDRNLRDVVLVGHSGGGAIVNGVADRIPDRVAGLVFIDSGPVPEGSAIADFDGPDGRHETERKAVDGWRLPLPDWETLGEANLAGLDQAKRDFMRANAADEPVRVATEPVKLRGGLRKEMPRWAILTTIPLPALKEMIGSGNPWFAPMGGPEWTLRELPTGHWPMLSEPERLAGMLAEWPAEEAVSRRKAS